MSYEYKIEHYGALEPDLYKLESLVGSKTFNSLDFMVSIDSTRSIIVAISKSPESQVAFAKTIQYMLTISDSVVIHDL